MFSNNSTVRQVLMLSVMPGPASPLGATSSATPSPVAPRRDVFQLARGSPAGRRSPAIASGRARWIPRHRCRAGIQNQVYRSPGPRRTCSARVGWTAKRLALGAAMGASVPQQRRPRVCHGIRKTTVGGAGHSSERDGFSDDRASTVRQKRLASSSIAATTDS